MRLLRFKVQNYKIVDDTDWVSVDPRVTALVGKNESGKTAIMKALWKTRNVANVTFDKLVDFPRHRYVRERKGTQNVTGLADGQYDVYATWRQNGQANVGLANFAISDGGGLATLNQFFGPAADLILGAYNFELLGTATVADGNLQVDLNAAGNNFILADAVAIVPVSAAGEVPEPCTMALAGLALAAVGGYARRRRQA